MSGPTQRTLSRRGLPILLAGLGLFAWQGLAPSFPSKRQITYRYPLATDHGDLDVRWMQGTEMLGQARFAVVAGQRQSSHELLLADGDYQLECDLPPSGSRGALRRNVHLDTATLTVVLE